MTRRSHLIHILSLALPLFLTIHLQPFSAAAASDEPVSTPIGTQTIGLTTGPFFPLRVGISQSSKLFGEAIMPSWMVTLTEPIGSGWYQGQLALGAEMIAFRTSEPITAYGVGFTPKLVYTSTAFGRVRPFLEAGGGPCMDRLGRPDS